MSRPSLYSAARERMRKLSRANRDALIALALIPPAYALLVWVEAFELLYEFSRSHEDWEIDELVSLFLVAGIAGTVFTVRRLLDLRSEVRRREQAENEAKSLSIHDALTGLPNRRYFLDRMNEEVARLAPMRECAIFFIDLDFFKPINDLYGHAVGDQVLCEVARRLSAAADGLGLVARLGGDEFGLLIATERDCDLSERIARRIVHDISQELKIGTRSLKLGVSVGVSVVNADTLKETVLESNTRGGGDDGKTIDMGQFLRRADVAMYRAKLEGRGQYCFFERQMDETLKLHMQLEAELPSAVATGEVVPYYQQLVDLSSGKTIGYEVLARWHHPAHGLVGPETFIPIAEDTGVISALTISLLQQAIEEAKNWPKDIFLSLNISPRQLADKWIAQEILGILTKSGFPPHRLEIEVTERDLVEKIDDVQGVLESLRNIGVKIALDDFGTGYSGLYHLRQLSVDTIKIDRSFVTNMLSSREEEKIVEAVINLSNLMGMKTIAEGIETPDVQRRLIELGCNSGQGHYFGEAQDASATRAALHNAPGRSRLTA
ncbi:MAG: EAL domain-containing protein [Rhodomicrobium sp.]|nr:EAL domain-containing protein [Rhodomicrobium sp.]